MEPVTHWIAALLILMSCLLGLFAVLEMSGAFVLFVYRACCRFGKWAGKMLGKGAI